jgi:hypothetical protein
MFQAIPAGFLKYRWGYTTAIKMSGKKAILTLLVAAMLLAGVVPAFAAAGLTVKTDLKYYTPGSTVAITGTAPAGVKVNIQINVTGTPVHTLATTATNDGKFTDSYTIPGNAAAAMYRVKVTTEDEKATASFYVLLVSTKKMAETLIDLADKAENLARETIDKLAEQEFTIPQAAEDQYNLGATALSEANSKLNDNPVGSIGSANKAMIHFRNAMVIAWRSTRVEDFAEHASQALDNRLERLTEMLEKTRDAVSSLTADDETANIMDKLNEVKDDIAEASNLLAESKVDEAAKKLTEAEKTLREALALIRRLLPKAKWPLMARFRENIQSRLDDCRNNLNWISGKLGKNYLEKAQTRLGLALGALANANQMIRNNMAEGAMEALQEASENLNEGITEVNGDYGRALGELNRMRAGAWCLRGTEALIRKWGQDPTAVQGRIGELEKKIDDATALVIEGKVEDAFKLFDYGRIWLPRMGKGFFGPTGWRFNRPG